MSKKEPVVCVRCGHVAEEKDQFCITCGAPLINRCADDKGRIHKGCGFVNKREAAYCAKCGYPTVFKMHGLI